MLIGHPFKPPHLMPLGEVVPTPSTDPVLMTQALEFYTGIGKVALGIKKEIPGFVASRLPAADLQQKKSRSSPH